MHSISAEDYFKILVVGETFHFMTSEPIDILSRLTEDEVTAIREHMDAKFPELAADAGVELMTDFKS